MLADSCAFSSFVDQIYVNGEDLTMTNEPLPLANMTLIMISKIKMYFMLPQDKK